jgi:hypothetical protein
MKLQIAVWFLIAGLAGTASFGGPEPLKAHYHCMCFEICKKVAESERCGLKMCNGSDPHYKAR